MAVKKSSNERAKRHKRVRRKVVGTPERPRLNVFRSSKHIYAQIVDDVARATLAEASSLQISEELSGKEVAARVGQMIAERATKKNIKRIVFDRSGYLYHGRIQKLAEGAREGGLDF